MTPRALLTLEDGRRFEGRRFGSPTPAAGEVVFNTGMVGYPETLTDPSYCGQILVLTYPLIGNYGVPEMTRDEFGLPVGFESERIQVSGLVVSEHAATYSHHKALRSLDQWLQSEGIPGVYDVDTRAITKHLRERGSMLGRIESSEGEIDFYDPNSVDLGSQVCCKDVTVYPPRPASGRTRAPRVVLVDCGCKANILRSLLVRGLEVVRVPHTHYFLSTDFDGLVISNGPGDPRMYGTATENVRRALSLGKPIFGICLGHQLLARALGADTYKMKFGHRGHNQPCIRQVAGEPPHRSPCVVTSQNHGYAVHESGLPDGWRVWFQNANDGTMEGLRHVSKPFFAVQFHPEATPGPTDTAGLFDEFAGLVRGGT